MTMEMAVEMRVGMSEIKVEMGGGKSTVQSTTGKYKGKPGTYFSDNRSKVERHRWSYCFGKF